MLWKGLALIRKFVPGIAENMMQNNSENQGLVGNFHSSLPLCVKSTWDTDHLVAKTSIPGLQEKEIVEKGPKREEHSTRSR